MKDQSPGPMPGAGDGLPQVTDIRRWQVQPGDRLIVHVDGSAGLGPAGAQEMARRLRDSLQLDDSVLVVVIAPGFRVEVMST